MKLSAIKVDSHAIEQGQIVDDVPGLPGVSLKVRGVDNSDWRRLQAELFANAQRGRDGKIDIDVADGITTKLLAEAGIVGWGGIEDDAGNPVPFDKATASEWLADPDMRRFRAGVMWACDQVANRSAEATEIAAKN